MKTLIYAFAVVLLPLISCALPPAGFMLDNVFSDHMVLQREKPIRVTGWADPETEVTGHFGQTNITVVTGADGRWLVEFPAQKAGGPYELTLSTERRATLKLTDLYVGDVWICSGQSNMEMPIWGPNEFYRRLDGDTFSQEFKDGKLRLLQVGKSYSLAGEYTELPGRPTWKVADTPSAIQEFSFTGLSFGQELRKALEDDVAIGLVNTSWGGSLIEPWIPYSAYVAAGEDFAWTVNRVAPFREGRTDGNPAEKKLSKQVATVLYNTMIAPLTVMNVRGTIWYQGCSNAGNYPAYARLQHMLIDSWRSAFRDPEMPFVITQLAGFHKHQPKEPLPEDFWKEVGPEELGYAPMRAVQFSAAREYPNTGIACAIDIGTHSDIHPKNKQEVGRRLAHEALRIAYGRSAALPGPSFASAKRAGDKVVVTLADTGNGLMAEGGAIGEKLFALAGADGKFAWAEATLNSDNTITVSSESVKEPVKVRYAYLAFPHQPNLYRVTDGLPLFPFEGEVHE